MARIQPLLPSSAGRRGRPFRDDRRVVEAIIYRYRCGIAWRDVPAEFGPWQTIWKRHRRYSGDGTWDRILATLLTIADARGEVDWSVSVDSTVNRAHQHGTILPRTTGGPSNYMNLFAEPDDHAIGRSRGGLSTKIHALVDGKGRPLVLLVAPGQGGDAPVFSHLMNQLKINRAGPGRPRTARTLSAVTRHTRRGRSGPIFTTVALRLSSYSRPIRSVIVNGVDPLAADLRPSTKRTAKAGTSLNGTSISSSNGVPWQCVTTNSRSRTVEEPFSAQSLSGWQL